MNCSCYVFEITIAVMACLVTFRLNWSIMNTFIWLFPLSWTNSTGRTIWTNRQLISIHEIFVCWKWRVFIRESMIKCAGCPLNRRLFHLLQDHLVFNRTHRQSWYIWYCLNLWNYMSNWYKLRPVNHNTIFNNSVIFTLIERHSHWMLWIVTHLNMGLVRKVFKNWWLVSI